MKKTIYFWLATLAAVLTFVFLGWAFSQHGTIGLFRVNGIFQKLFIILGVFGLALLGLALLERLLQYRQQKRSTRILSISVRNLTLVGIIIFVFAFFYIGMIPGPLNGSQAPQLLVEDGSGINGVPNLAIVFNTSKPTSSTVIWGQENSNSTQSDAKPSKQHVFALNNLQPDTKY